MFHCFTLFEFAKRLTRKKGGSRSLVYSNTGSFLFFCWRSALIRFNVEMHQTDIVVKLRIKTISRDLPFSRV